MLQASIVATTVIIALAPAAVQADDGPKTLLTRIAEWQYPGAKISGASMSDGATVNEQGNRTVPSIHCKTMLTTTDPINKVVEYYKSRLNQKTKPGKEKKVGGKASNVPGRSVTYHSDSGDRPVVIHIISVNEGHVSTTLVISRSKGETKTHIAWSQYEKFLVSRVE
ncbi:MAG: hypothetical protein HON53_11305 [Planctomycetaceae bacterium]|jgi:hypothetical protein|nr:hypothetical protein [Planctomycetaceae bacterium]MBT6153422.1 hypothetical protein [Planctomycetaceae bacterium]MBT6485020.1 hypothetical protein [Planctomycetaceae bacterium]MBT6497494.1 hypothetical protein [Planctomycetaceae bacterium]